MSKADHRPSRRSALLTIAGSVAACQSLDLKARDRTNPHTMPLPKAPPQAIDCHIHIYDSRFPLAPSAVLKPNPATVTDYHLLQKRIGTSRCVVVQPSSYGTDNRCLLDALQQFGPAEARGIAVVNTTVSDTQLHQLHQAGVRGIRFNLLQAGATTLDMLAPLSERIAALGWHVQVNASSDQIVAAASLFNRLPCPLVFDHFGHTLPAGRQNPAFNVLVKLLQSGKGWLKMSGAYMSPTYTNSKPGLSAYADSLPAAQAYVQEAPNQLVWGSDWPHPTEKIKPDDVVLIDLLSQWVPDDASRSKILVDNSARLYGFKPDK